MDDLREKLQNLESLMNKLLDKEVLQKDSLINHLGSYDDTKDDGISFKTTAFHDNDGCRGDCDRSNSPNNCSSSWEMTMCCLAKELETICSRGSSPMDSPSSPSSTVSPCLTPTNAIATPSPRGLWGGRGGRISHQGSLSEASNNDPFHVPPPPPPPFPSAGRPVRVRHEETEDRLDRSLTMICRHNSPEQPPGCRGGGCDDEGGDEKGATKGRNAPQLKYRDSAKHGLRFRLDLNGRDPDQTTVSMDTDDHILRVFSAGKMIHLLQLAENTDPQTLSCAVIDDGAILFVKQRWKETICMEIEGRHSTSSSTSSSSTSSPSSSEVHLPVVRHDETTLTMTVTLRIPPCLHGNDDIVVKTIDDTLMIKVGGSSTTTFNPESSRFSVVMNLPEGTDSRTVCAWVSKGQLTVKGQLVPASRRMTCAF